MIFTYRTGHLEDIHQIKALTLKAYGQFKNLISQENFKAWEENMGMDETYIQLFRTGTCFVATSDEKIIGTAFVIPNGNSYKWFDAEWSYIRLVGVLPEFEGKGIGKKLTSMCIDHAKKTGEKIIALHTSEFQNAARHIYESLGFKKYQEFDLFGKIYWVFLLQLD